MLLSKLQSVISWNHVDNTREKSYWGVHISFALYNLLLEYLAAFRTTAKIS